MKLTQRIRLLEAQATKPEGIAATIVRFWALRKLKAPEVAKSTTEQKQ